MPGSHQDDTEVKCHVGIVSGGSCALEFEDVEELGVSVGELVEDGGDPARVPGHVVAYPTAPHGALRVPAPPELQWCQHVRPRCDTAGIGQI